MASNPLAAVLQAPPRRFRPYPKYKGSGIEGLGDIPAHWQVRRLKTIARVQLSNVDKKSVEGDVPVRLCNYVDVYYNDHITSAIDFMSATATPEQRRRFSLRRGDVLITKDSESWTDIAVPAVVAEDLDDVVCGYHLAHIRPLEELDGRFLARAFSAVGPRDQFQIAANGITRFGLSGDAIKDGLFGLPPLPEQRAIADFLDRETAKIDALMAKKQRVIELLQEKRAALVTQAVSKGLDPNVRMKDSGIEWLGEFPAHWRVSRLKFVASRIVDCPHETPVYSDDGDYRVIRTADVGEGTLDLSNARRVTDEEYRQRIRRMSLEADDIVYSREGERFGFAALLPSGLGACLGQRMMQFRLSPRSSPRYVMWQLNSKATYQQAALDTSGATSPHVNVETIKNFWLAVPPRSEQDSIAKHIDRHSAAIDSLAAKIHAGIDRLKEFRAALISAAVTGKIDVREEAA